MNNLWSTDSNGVYIYMYELLNQWNYENYIKTMHKFLRNRTIFLDAKDTMPPMLCTYRRKQWKLYRNNGQISMK